MDVLHLSRWIRGDIKPFHCSNAQNIVNLPINRIMGALLDHSAIILNSIPLQKLIFFNSLSSFKISIQICCYVFSGLKPPPINLLFRIFHMNFNTILEFQITGTGF